MYLLRDFRNVLKMKRKNVIISFIVITASIFLLSFMTFSLQEGNILRSLVFKLESYVNLYPWQKVYLHLDKERYSADEKIWFKAYLVDAKTHLPDNSSTNLYVELINPGGYIVQTKLIRLENGFGHGDFSLRDTVPDGYYRIRAFTNYMMNFGEDFYFSKDIYLSNPYYTTYATRETVNVVKKSHRKNLKKQLRYDIRFLPEGGYLLSNVSNRVAFKAINELGVGIEIKGVLKDNKGNYILDFSDSHKGMGSFEFIPAPGKKYTAKVIAEGGREHTFSLPDAIDMGINLRADKQAEYLKVSIITNIEKGNLPPNTIYYLIGHTRGEPLYNAEIELKDPSTHSVFIPLKDLPSGILHLTLFNYKPAAVSERLVFINNNDNLRIKTETDRTIVKIRDKINVSINVTDVSGFPAEAELSLSVSELPSANTTGNILSYLLLRSDLQGNIEEPDYYFTDLTVQKEQHLDILMMTQGWRRFDWNTVILSQNLPLKYNKEQGIEITGRITREFFNIPLKDIPVTMTIMDQYNDVFKTRSDLKGRYRFTNLYYQDTITVRIEAHRESGRKNLLIIIDGKEQEKVEDMNYNTSQFLVKPGPMGKYMIPEEPEEEDPFHELNTRINRIHSEPKDVIIVDERMSSYQSVAQILQGRIPGVNVTGNKVIIRGINTIYGSTDPLFLVDGIPVDGPYAMSMNPVDIERIEILKGPEAAIYGVRGANGVIAIYTKRGKFMIKGRIDFKMLGYAVPSEFYSPKYTSSGFDPFEDNRRTLLWVPTLKTNSTGKAKLDFYTSDIPGRYIITVEGIDKSGKAGTGISYLEVK